MVRNSIRVLFGLALAFAERFPPSPKDPDDLCEDSVGPIVFFICLAMMLVGSVRVGSIGGDESIGFFEQIQFRSRKRLHEDFEMLLSDLQLATNWGPKLVKTVVKRARREIQDQNAQTEEEEIRMRPSSIVDLICKAVMLRSSPDQNDFHNIYKAIGSAKQKQKFRYVWNYLAQELLLDNVDNVSNKREVTFSVRGLGALELKELRHGWRNSRKKITSKLSFSEKKVEDIGGDKIQICFCGPFVGLGVLSGSDVPTEEENFFFEYPELLAIPLKKLDLFNEECLVIKGVKRFFRNPDKKVAGDEFEPIFESDSYASSRTIVAMSAKNYLKDTAEQFENQEIERELGKAFVAFASNPWEEEDEEKEVERRPIATSHWGCKSSVGGDKELKAVIQLLAATEHDRPLVYCDVDSDFRSRFSRLHMTMVDGGITTSDVLKSIDKFRSISITGMSDSLFYFLQSDFGRGIIDYRQL